MFAPDARPQGIRAEEFVPVSSDASLRDLLVAVEQQPKWSGRVVATARFLLAVDEYVRAGVVEEAAGRSDTDAEDWRGHYVISIAVGAARDKLRDEAVGRYCRIESELPATLRDLLALERRVVDDWVRSVHSFLVDVQSRDAGLAPAWSALLVVRSA